MVSRLTEITAIPTEQRYRRESFAIHSAKQAPPIRDDQPRAFGLMGESEEDDFAHGVAYRFYGLWDKGGQYGPTFKFNSFAPATPHGHAGIVAYLQQARHVGRATAEILWDEFGAEAVQVLRESPERAAEVYPRFSLAKAQEAAEDLQRLHAAENVTIQLMDLFDGRGFGKACVKQALTLWGASAVDILQRDPYKAMAIRGVGFLKADRFYLDLGKPANKLKRQAYCLTYHTLKASEQEGHCWVPVSHGVDALKATIAGTDVSPEKAMTLAIRGKILKQRTDAVGRVWIADVRRAESERYVCEHLVDALYYSQEGLTVPEWETRESVIEHKPDHTRCARCHRKLTAATVAVFDGQPYGPDCITRVDLIGDGHETVSLEDWLAGQVVTEVVETTEIVGAQKILSHTDWPSLDQPEFTEGDKPLTQHQRDELAKALSGPIGILGGRPGTGKSHTLVRLVRALVRLHGRTAVKVMAPTGKASQRVKELMTEAGLSGDVEPTTIHRGLGVESSGEGGWSFVHCEANPLDCSYLIVEECFAPGTAVDTPLGQIPIESIHVGDPIYNANGVDHVVAIKKTAVDACVSVYCGEAEVCCSKNHKFLTSRGWIIACELKPGDSLVPAAEAVRLLRDYNSAQGQENSTEAFLQRILRDEMDDAISRDEEEISHKGASNSRGSRKEAVSSIRMSRCCEADSAYPRTEPNVQGGVSPEGIEDAETNWPSPPRVGRQRAPHADSAIATASGTRQAMDSRVCCENDFQRTVGEQNPTVSLQNRHRTYCLQNCDRSRRPKSLQCVAAAEGPEEGRIFEVVRVDRVEVHEQGSPILDRFRDACGQSHFYDIQAARHPSFSVGGCLVHNCSMVGTGLMRSLLAARAKNCHVLFVGDVNQLPPVEYGAPLRDMTAAGLPYGELREIHRNAGSIVQVCSAIVDGRPWEADESLDLKAEQPKNLVLIPASKAAATQKIIHLLENIRDNSPFDPVWDCQVVVAVNKRSPLSRVVLNKALQDLLNPLAAGANGSGKGLSLFRVNDKVIQLKNGFLMHAIKNMKGEWKPSDEKYLVCNGEIGRVIAAEEKKTIVEFPGEKEPRLVFVPRGAKQDAENGNESSDESSGTGCDLDLAYAVTCHKLQGSQAPLIIVCLDEYPGATGEYGVCDKAWLYTAISRAQKACFLVGMKHTAGMMTSRTFIHRRKTFMVEDIRTLAAKAGVKLRISEDSLW